MEAQSIKAYESPPRVTWIANIAIIISCLVGIPVIMGWIPATLSPFSDSTVLAKAKPDEQSASTIKQTAKKIPAAPAPATSNAPAEANRAGYGDTKLMRKLDAKEEGSGPISENNSNIAPR